MIARNLIYTGVICSLFSCVSIKEYNAKRAELDALNEGTKTMRKELRELEKEKKILLDTIGKRNARASATSEAIQRRLAALKIKNGLKAESIKGLSIFSPVMSPESYAEMMERYTSRDTWVAKNITWLTEKEKKIYYYLNYARLNPVGFCNRYILPKLKYDSSNVYLLTLVDYMYSMKPRNAVKPDKVQYDNAKCHATTSGALGYVGHERQSAKCKSGFSGECCSYGVDDPLGIILQLLIDQSTPSLGHRYICLGWYETCGIATASHKGYGTNTVLDFR